MKDCMGNSDSVHLYVFTIAQSLITSLHTFIHNQMLCLEGISRGHLVPPCAQGRDQLDWNYSWQMFVSPVLRVLQCYKLCKTWRQSLPWLFLLNQESFSIVQPRYPWLQFKPITTCYLPNGHRELFILLLFLFSLCVFEGFHHIAFQSSLL